MSECNSYEKNTQLPTWNEWLHTIYNYYNGFGKTSFIEWLNTVVPQEAAELFNIPNKKDL